MFEVAVSASFSATHQVRLSDSSYESPHSHDWRVKVTYAGARLDSSGLLVDFVAVRARLDAILANLRDRHLNDLPCFAPAEPTAENVAAHIAHRMAAVPCPNAELRCVEVEEEPGCYARWLSDTPYT
ncbi:MAG: 6-carboxytetrahydropterin synthase [Planctomycetota bacterium]